MSRRRSTFERGAVVAAVAVVIASATFAAVRLAAAATRSQAGVVCTHGMSSVGPVFVRNGKVVGGDTTPHTEACLP